MESMYQQLMQLPLFQGVGTEKIAGLVEKIPFHFLKFHNGDAIISQGDPCTHVKFVVSGQVKTETQFRHLKVTMHQTLSAPNVIGPNFLFGRDTTAPYTVTAHDTCGILQLLKSDYLKVLQSDKVFLFNILNYLSLTSQKANTSLLAIQRGTVREKLAFLIEMMVSHKSSDIELTYQQKDLCRLLSTQRNALVRALEEMAEQRLIEYTSTRLRVLDKKSLLARAGQ